MVTDICFFSEETIFNDVDDDLRGNLHLVKESEFKKQSEGNLFPEECLLVESIKSSTNTKIASLYREFQEKRNQAILNLEQLQNMFHLDEEAITKVRKSLNPLIQMNKYLGLYTKQIQKLPLNVMLKLRRDMNY